MCVVSGVPPTPIVVTAFSVEADTDCAYDFLMIDGARFLGTSSPHGVRVTGGLIAWTSDESSTEAGWELCWPLAPPRSPPAPLWSSIAPLPPPPPPPSPLATKGPCQ
eukprot:3084947-Prymnesium_polylepis.1